MSEMMGRRRILQMLAVATIAAALGWIWTRNLKTEPEPEYFVIQTVNAGTPDEQTTIERIYANPLAHPRLNRRLEDAQTNTANHNPHPPTQRP